uniref:Uncharacterized protein n=1 Tax=Meloidogyne enterolobii TaxID=390850 RepID=A0A6V7X4D8_MELEN|nr:unnamed protein product [Meloidogyne enterolobii]
MEFYFLQNEDICHIPVYNITIRFTTTNNSLSITIKTKTKRKIIPIIT